MKGVNLEQKGSCRCLDVLYDVRTTGWTSEASLRRDVNPIQTMIKDQRGFTLIEVMVLVVVLAVMILTIYIGVVYAEKQTLLNYRNRVATFIASGEIDKQYTLYMKEGYMRPYSGKQVVIDDQSDSILRGNVSISVKRDVEYNVSKQYGYSSVVAEVSWTDPENKKNRRIVLREDFYDVEGKVNP